MRKEEKKMEKRIGKGGDDDPGGLAFNPQEMRAQR
jgi:hypothetical protein